MLGALRPAARRLPIHLQARRGAATDTAVSDLMANLTNVSEPPVAPRGEGSSTTNPIGKMTTAKEEPYRLHVMSLKHNTINNFTRPNGMSLARASGGSCGFKGKNEAGYEAGYQCAVKIFQAIEAELNKVPSMELEIFFKGYGQGREALKGALLTSEGEMIRPMIVRITDTTPIRIGGTRPKKQRRL